MGKTFGKVNVCIAGDFGSKGDKIKQWVEANGGTFSKELDHHVTHLISTQNAFRRSISIIREAKRMKGLKIVSIDWLEDSLLSKSRRPAREGAYLFKRGKKKAPIAGDLQPEQKAKPAKKEAKPKTELDAYRTYEDKEGVRHSAILIRPTEAGTSREKHDIKLVESTAEPRTYATHVKYTRRGRVASDFLAPIGSTWQEAYGAFDKFLRAKAGFGWVQRGSRPAPKRSKEGAELPPHEGWFEYKPEVDQKISVP